MIDIHNPDFKMTLKETSLDSSAGVYMTESEMEVIGFDYVKTAYANSFSMSEEYAASVDAIIERDSAIEYFVEFKNGKVEPKTKRNIKDKAKDSLLIVSDLCGITVSNTRNSAIFILVYNEEKNRQGHQCGGIQKHVMELGNEELIRFDLEKLKLYFKEVHTYNENEFEEFLKTTFPE